MHSRQQSRRKEWTRNIVLIGLAVFVVWIFFQLDFMQSGDSVFNREANDKLTFAGDLESSDFSIKEKKRLLAYINRHKKLIRKVVIDASPQDDYKKLSDKSEIIFELHVRMRDGGTMDTPARRSTRGELVSSVLKKLKKDVPAYEEMLKKGRKVKSLINTM